MDNVAKELIKNVNDGNMSGTKENFETLIANKVYDKLQDKKEELSQKIFSKEVENEEQPTAEQPAEAE